MGACQGTCWSLRATQGLLEVGMVLGGGLEKASFRPTKGPSKALPGPLSQVEHYTTYDFRQVHDDVKSTTNTTIYEHLSFVDNFGPESPMC